MKAASTELRFEVGDRVSCKVGPWMVGTVVKLGYMEEFFDQNGKLQIITAPYQIRLDNGQYIMAPEDKDYCIMESNIPHMCANCGKSGDNLKYCSACKVVKYCGAECQRSNRKLHKEECKQRVLYLHDVNLFKDPPQKDDCPICFQPIPIDQQDTIYQACCGKQVSYVLFCFCLIT